MPGSRRPSQNDTLTFLSEELTYDEVRNIFQRYGELKYVNKYFDRFFVQFETPEQAKKAHSNLGRNFRVTFAHVKSKPRARKNYREEGELIRIGNPEDLPRSGYSVASDENEGLAMIEAYVNSPRKPNAAASEEMARSVQNRVELAKSYENLRENIMEHAKNAQSRREADKNSENQSPEARKLDSPKPSTSKVQDPEPDSPVGPGSMKKDVGVGVEVEEFDEGKAEAEQPAAEGSETEDECEEEEDVEDEGEEDEEGTDEEDEEESEEEEEEEEDEESIEAQARALSAGGLRKVRIGDLENIKKELGHDMTHSVIVVNIPDRYNLNQVYDLVEEVKPIAFSEMDYSTKMRVKFCEVYVNDAADVDYLKRKLNDFVICGKQLTVMEPAEILDETRWNA